LTNDQVTNTSKLVTFELAKFVLSKIMKNEYCLENGRRALTAMILISKIIYFIMDTGWIRNNVTGTYAITTNKKHNRTSHN
jgi:hypothetical protein